MGSEGIIFLLDFWHGCTATDISIGSWYQYWGTVLVLVNYMPCNLNVEKKSEEVFFSHTLPLVHDGRVGARGAVAARHAAVGGAAHQSDAGQHPLHAAGVVSSSTSSSNPTRPAVSGVQQDLSCRVVALTGSWGCKTK